MAAPGDTGEVTVARMTNAEIGAAARALGHTGLALVGSPSGRTWHVDCECGWSGRPFVVQGEAIKQAQHHLREAVKKSLRDGVSSPSTRSVAL